MATYGSGPTDRGPGRTRTRTTLGGGRGDPSSMLWKDPRKGSLVVEGQEQFAPGMISSSENQRRLALIKGYTQKQKARSKIKPIADPEADKSERRKTAARRRQGGRVGTVLSETLG